MADIEPVIDFYGRWASVYDLVARHTPGLASVRTRLATTLDLQPGETVVEMGCGTGANLPYLREQVGASGRVVGVDITPGVLRRAGRRINRRGWTNVHLVKGDATRPPVERADAIVGTFVVGMLEDPAAAVDEWQAIVAPGGRIGLLDATPTDRDRLAPLNGLFRAFVRLTAPPGSRLRYVEPPADVLDRRVAAARSKLKERCGRVSGERLGFGFLDLAVGAVDTTG